MKSLNKIDKKIQVTEPFKNLFTQGMVCHEAYKDLMVTGSVQMRYLKLTRIQLLKYQINLKFQFYRQNQCLNQKNTIDPETMISNYGADVVRWFILSDSPPEKDIQWSDRVLYHQINFCKDFGI